MKIENENKQKLVSKEKMYNNAIEEVIGRVKQMEFLMEEVLEILEKCPEYIQKDEIIARKIAVLEFYQESGQWLSDYECDERGELPPDLKRGILSEDRLYNLLCDIKLWR